MAVPVHESIYGTNPWRYMRQSTCVAVVRLTVVSVCGLFLEPVQVTLDLPVQPFRPAVCLRAPYCTGMWCMSDRTSRFSNPDTPFFFASDSGMEPRTAISQYGCRPSVIPDGLPRYCRGVLHSGMIRCRIR